MSASLGRLPSVASGLRVSVQPTKPTSSIWHLCERYRKVIVFSVPKIFTTLCAPFPNRMSSLKVLAMSICSIQFLCEPMEALHIPLFRSRDHICDISSKITVMSFMQCDFTA